MTKRVLAALLMVCLFAGLLPPIAYGASEHISTIRPSCAGYPSEDCYTSLSAWEAAQQRKLTPGGGGDNTWETVNCYSMQDTTAFVIDGWTTGSTNYIQIQTPSSERHPGYYSTSKFRLETSGAHSIEIREDYVRVYGLQIQLTSTSAYAGIYLDGQSASNEIRIAYNLIKGVVSGGAGYAHGIYVSETTAGYTNVYIWNNIIYDMFNTDYPNSTAQYGIRNQYGTVYAYNNTVYKAAVCYYADNGGTYPFYSVNNVGDCYDQNPSYYTDFSGTFTSSDYNASTDTTAPGGNSQTNADPVYENEGSDDFRLASGDTDCKENGTSDPGSGLFSDDIVGTSRPQSTNWDIGAFEVVAGGDADVNLTGESSTASPGSLSVSGDASISPTGESATASEGTLTVNVTGDGNVDLTGEQSVASTGDLSVSGDTAIPLAGESATSTPGSLSVSGDVDIPLSGESATSAHGTLDVTADVDIPLTGEQATGSPGDLSVSGDVDIDLTGEEATAYDGTLTVIAGGGGDANVNPTGEEATASLGSITVSADVNPSLSGEQANASTGSISVAGDTDIPLTGETATATDGTVAVSGDAQAPLTGEQVTAYSGSVTVSGDATVNLSGVVMVASAGSLNVSGVAIPPVGVERRIFEFDNAVREMEFDNERREFQVR